jgi:5'-AMP-activated protein kinase, catalytic alpha subunit
MDGRNILMDRYEIGKQLGQGTFAKVFYARNLTTGQGVAIKMIHKDKVMKVGLMEQIKREISIMRLVRHPNVLQLFEVMASKSKIYFVLEYAKGGELFNKISKGGKLTEDAARKYFQQLIGAVDYCHGRGVYHRDLKPENLLLDENENLKVSDFGLSALAESKRQDGLLHTTCGTPAYVAPEVLSRKGYDGTNADVWSCGVILFVLVAGYLPFHDTNLIEMYRKISRAEFRCPRGFSTELKDLLYKILDPDPSSRISISRIKRSAWYRKPIEVHAKKSEAETTNKTVTGEATTSGSAECSTSEGNQGSLRLPNLNAFDIISLSTGFDLSGFFDYMYSRKEHRFSTRQPAAVVFTKLKELARRLKLKVKKKENGTLKLAAPKEGKKGILELDADIFEVAPSLLLVELKKTNGDTLEYQKLVKEEIRPALKDIVWVWQGDQHQQSQPTLQGQQPQSAFSSQQSQDELQPSLLQQERRGLVETPSPAQEPLDQSHLPITPGQPEQSPRKGTLDHLQVSIASEQPES